MSEATKYPEIMRAVRRALYEDCGVALARKFAGVDNFFKLENYRVYADDLLQRMVSPILNDSVDRIVRDPARKLGWNDRIIGAIRLSLAQGVNPSELAAAVVLNDDVIAKWQSENNFCATEADEVVKVVKAAQIFAYSGTTGPALRNYIADMDQLTYARLSTLAEGDGRGNRIIEVNNGSGLSFTVVPDRGMDIVEASFRGIPLAFRAPAGHVHVGRFESTGFEWLRAWAGGLLTTCGLRHVGPPEDDTANPLDARRGLHGRISSHGAEDVGISRDWQGGRYEIALTGTLREAMMFGENLRLKRKISTALGDNSIYLEDLVTNLGSTPEHIQILYHCNFGYPFIAPGIEITAVEHDLKPRDEVAAAGIANWRDMVEPQPGVKEQCFLHRIPPQSEGWAEIAVDNPAIGVRVTVAYDAATLPNLMQWKLCESGRYVLGLEPTNTTVSGRNKDIAAGVAPLLPPGESLTFRVSLTFIAN